MRILVMPKVHSKKHKSATHEERYPRRLGVKLLATVGVVLFALLVLIDMSWIVSQDQIVSVFISFILFLILFLLLAALLFSYPLGPILSIHKLAMRFAHGSFTQRAHVQSKDELGDIANALNRMAGELQQSKGTLERDIPDRIRILENERDRYQAVLKSIGDAAVIIDSQGNIIFWNATAEQLIHFTAQEALGKPYDEILRPVHKDRTPIAKESRAIQRALTRGDVTRSQVYYRTKEDSLVPVRTSTAPVREANGSIAGVVTVFEDASREEELDRVKSEFITVTSHQIRTPLSSVKWSSEILLSGDLGPLNTAQQGYVEQVLRSTERLISIVSDLLNIALIEEGKVAVEAKPAKLDEIVDHVVSDLITLARPRNLTVTVKKKTAIPELTIDRAKISQVVHTLIFNAIMYSVRKGEVSVLLAVDGDSVLFECKDEGVGIPRESQGRVFEKFFRASNVLTIEPSGTGVGLYLAKLMVEAHGGKIWFDSHEGHGSTFSFSLPIPKTGSAVSAPTHDSVARAGADSQG